MADILKPSLDWSMTLEQENDTLSRVDIDEKEVNRGTIFYLAYGSNLSREKFLGDRGIRPISQKNVVVPSLRLTFNLNGFPYSEPCFANSGIRDPKQIISWSPLHNEANTSSETCVADALPTVADQKRPIRQPKYRKDRWQKGLVGVVYELTQSDYAHVIATEGGGAKYHDIKVPCYPLDPNAKTVPESPTSTPITAHTLYAPPGAPDENWPEDRPDPSYAQPSARYLKLITDGAKELGLPYEYQDYLLQIHPYRIEGLWLYIGSLIFTTIWAPFVTILLRLQKRYAGPDGKSPKWLATLFGGLFKSVWWTYDTIFKPIFGDGERTKSEIEEKIQTWRMDEKTGVFYDL